MKIRSQELNEKQRIETLDALYTAAGAVRGREGMKRFLRDLLTESGRIMLGRRILKKYPLHFLLFPLPKEKS